MAMELNLLRRQLKDLGERIGSLRGFFEYDRKKERLEEVSLELVDPAIWQDPAKAQELGKERARLTTELAVLDRTTQGTAEASELLDLAEAEGDESAARDIDTEAQRLEAEVRKLEFKRMFSGEMDAPLRVSGYPGRRGGDGGPGLGPDAAADVSAMGGCTWICLRGHRLQSR